jgi:hypothetical protein
VRGGDERLDQVVARLKFVDQNGGDLRVGPEPHERHGEPMGSFGMWITISIVFIIYE